jgi:hypothetical protein
VVALKLSRQVSIILTTSLPFLWALCLLGGYSVIIWTLCGWLARPLSAQALDSELISTLYRYEQTPKPTKLIDDPAALEALQRAKQGKAKELGGGPSGELRSECLYEGEKLS